jgi:hypothetical protein
VGGAAAGAGHRAHEPVLDLSDGTGAERRDGRDQGCRFRCHVLKPLDIFANFFIASASASAAFTGLLFVAITVVNLERSDTRTKARITALAGSSFALLVDAFFVAIIGLTVGVTIFAIANVVMALFGLFVTSQLLPAVIRAGNFARDAPHRYRNIALPMASITTYLLQIGFGAAVVFLPSNAVLVHLLVLIALGLYAGALSRAWEITSGTPR